MNSRRSQGGIRPSGRNTAESIFSQQLTARGGSKTNYGSGHFLSRSQSSSSINRSLPFRSHNKNEGRAANVIGNFYTGGPRSQTSQGRRMAPATMPWGRGDELSPRETSIAPRLGRNMHSHKKSMESAGNSVQFRGHAPSER